MKKRLGAYLSMALITLTAANAGADLLFYDGFDYTYSASPLNYLAPRDDTAATPNPGLYNSAYDVNWRYAGAGGTANNAPAIASTGLSYAYAGVSPAPGNSVAFDPTQLGSARIQVTPTAISSGTVYWSGLLQVGTVANLNTVNGMLLGGFNNGTGPGTLPGTVGAILRIRGASADTYNIGTGMNTGTQAGNIQYTTTAFSEGETVFVVGAYEYVAGASNDRAYMWINPSASDFGSPPAGGPDLTSNPGLGTEFGSLMSFNLRNVNTVGAPTGVLFDELRVGTTWADVMPTLIPEPAATSLLGLGMLALVGWHRSRRH